MKKERKDSQKPSKNTVVKKPKIIDADTRMRKKPRYKSFRLHKKVKHTDGPLPSWFKLTKRSFRLMWQNKKALLWFLVIYTLIYFIFVRGFSIPVDIGGVRDSFSKVSTGENYSALAVNFSVFTLMLQSVTSAAGDIAGLYQVFFVVISALALIWLFRQQQAGSKVTMKMAFYRGMYPIIPFIFLIMVAGLQLIPASIGNYLFQTVIQSGIAINSFEQTIWFLLFTLLLLLSLYLISATVVALFVVTLPEMTPMRALRKAKQLVQFRRFSVLRKVFALILIVISFYLLTVFPAIFVSPFVAQFLFFTLTTLIVPFAVGYLFVLYRELL